MARPLRIEFPGGRYHVTSRGNERRNIFRDDRDRFHFLELLSELPERFGTRLHAYVQMANHYHLLLETPEANLSRAGQWLNVSYSVWFNRRHRRSGHLFQGRFSAVIIEDDQAFQDVGRYMHLNPVRIKALFLDKQRQKAARLGLGEEPAEAIIAQRLHILRQWRWSSYPAYAGYVAPPPWLITDLLGRACGGRNPRERQAALRAYTEEAVREGMPDRPWDRVIGGLVLGSQPFAEELSKLTKGNPREQPGLRRLNVPVRWEQIIGAIEAVKQAPWKSFRDRHGDWGRDAALWFGRRSGRLSLRTLAELAGGLDYTAAGKAVSRFTHRLEQDQRLANWVQEIQSHLSNVEIAEGQVLI